MSGAGAAGLTTSRTEGTGSHLHAHLAVIVDGEAVTVPAGIGVDRSRGAFAELHTHDDSGLLHLQSSTQNKRYILAQLFRVWQVRLDETGVGGLDDENGKILRAYVDGREVVGNPAGIELMPRQQIALVYGPADVTVRPPMYTFAPGD
ncbi:MAG: hypothetical protein GEV10_17520 [Streptosporangiales bacterium]|nr:hypothetical protein [Streptosporangiales bacterium]